MSESVFCHACMATTSSEARYSNAGDRVCPACESDFIELTQAPPVVEQPQANDAASDRNARRADRRNQGFHRHFTTPGGHNVHLHVVTSMGGLPQPLESLLSNAEPAQLTALLNNMQGMTLPFNLPPGVSAADYGPNGGAAFDNLLQQLMEAHQPQASPTSRDTLAQLPRRKVRPAAGSDTFSNTPNNLPAACGSGEPCSVCHDSMEEGVEVVELPCQHCYHEDCITAWLKDHNTCPVCRKELPVDEELRNEQQQSRQQRFQQDMQQQPAGLQSLFGALNPFHLLGRNRNNARAGSQEQGTNSNRSPAPEAQNGNAPAALPSETAERLQTVRSELQQLESRLRSALETLDNNEERAVLEQQIAEAQAQLAQLSDSADAVVDALQIAQAAEFGQGAEALEAAFQADQDDMPSLVSTGSGEEDATEADLPTSEEASDSDGDDELPELIADDSGSEDSDIEDQANQQHISASIIGMDADLQMLESWLQPPAATPATANPAAEHASVGIDGALDGPDSDMEMPPLVDMASFDGLVGAASGRHTPLDLDQQAALDDLSLDMDEASDLIERVTQGLQQRADSAAQSPQQPSPQAATANGPVVQSQTHPDRRVVQRINTDSTPQNPAGPLQQQPSGLALVTAPEGMAEHVQANALPATQTHMEAALPSATAADQPELRSHPLLPTPSRKRSFDLSEGTSSIAGSPTSVAAERLAAVNGDGSLGAVDVEDAQEGQQRGGNLLAPVAWAARGAGRLVGSILRRTNSGRR